MMDKWAGSHGRRPRPANPTLATGPAHSTRGVMGRWLCAGTHGLLVKARAAHSLWRLR